jgi:hypothetical protein
VSGSGFEQLLDDDADVADDLVAALDATEFEQQKARILNS